MKIIPQPLNIDIKDEAVRIYLSQIPTFFDKTTKRISNPQEKWDLINSIFHLVSSASDDTPFNFLILPEIAVPYRFVLDAVNRIRESFPENSVTIFGIELVTVAECKRLISELAIEDAEAIRVLQNREEDCPINACLVVVKEGIKKCRCYLQFKITHSKFQGALDTVENLMPSDYLYHFQSPSLSFITLICSDFFNRPAGALCKIIDEIDFNIMKKGLPLDFFFNIQYNPSPDHELFLHSLSKIYDDGYRSHGNLCTILLNSILSGYRKGGLSKILFYKESKLPEKQPIKQIDAPVVGYELTDKVTLTCLSFDRLPRSWDSARDTYPLHIESLKLVDKKWVHNREKNSVRYLAPMEKEVSLDYETYEELANRFSNLGDLKKSIEWAQKALSHWEKERNYHRAASMAQFMAIQYRHQGNFNEALKIYAKAESLILCLEHFTPSSTLTRWRILLGKVMVEEYLIKGRCKEAYTKYQTFSTDIDEYLSTYNHPDDISKTEIELYKTHIIRQQAEMLRLLGCYKKALRLFTEAYNRYSYVYAEEKAYSALGQADCHRLLGKHEIALRKYDEAEEYATVKKDKRLLARVLRNKAELYRVIGNDKVVFSLLSQLAVLSEETNYLLGKIYFYLIKGADHLSSDPKKSIEVLTQIQNLIPEFSKTHLKIEYAHYILGLAEAKRLSGEPEARTYYEQAYKLYKETGVLWGIVRASIGISILSRSSPPLDQLLRNLRISDPLDADFVKKANAGQIDEFQILFLNMP
jgi:tetratricopeptide (TPR) repeat protein